MVLATAPGGYMATVTPAGAQRGYSAIRSGTAPTIDEAIGRAMGRPGLRFASDSDEREAQILTFRQRAFSVLARDDRLCTIGLR